MVPDPPEALTSNAGWDTVKHLQFLEETVKIFHSKGIRVSIFTDTDLKNIEYAAKTGTDRIELYTEPYAEQFLVDKFQAVKPFAEAAAFAHKCKLGVNAGHDLSLVNLKYFAQNVPFLDEVSIGHALISDALYFGLESTIQKYRQQLTF